MEKKEISEDPKMVQWGGGTPEPELTCVLPDIPTGHT